MFGWLKQVLGIGGAAFAATSSPAAADPTDPFAIYLDAARDLLGEDPDALDMMTLARDDPAAFEQAQNQIKITVFSDYIPGEDPIGLLFRDVMVERGHLVYLDWKDGPYEFAPLYDEQMARLNLAPLTAAQHAALEVIGNTPRAGAERAYFLDYLPFLDRDATAKGYRILVFDENADSYAFFVVTPDQFARWADVRLGPEHQFFSPASFGVDQSK